MGHNVVYALRWIREHPVRSYATAAATSLGMHTGLLYYWNHQQRSDFFTPYMMAEMAFSLAAPAIIAESLRLARNISSTAKAFYAMQGINIGVGLLRYGMYDLTHAPRAAKSAGMFTALTIASTFASTVYARKQQWIVDILHKYNCHTFEKGMDFINGLTNRGHPLGPCAKSLEQIIDEK